MRTGLKIFLGLFFVGQCSLTTQARSADITDDNISEMVEFSLKRTEHQNGACKTSRRSVTNKCGMSYIYPVLANHPDNEISNKINTFIEELAPEESLNFSRIESWTEVMLNKENVLSLSYSGQMYGRGAISDQALTSCTNMDLSTGREITLDDVLDQGYQKTIPKLISANLETDLKYKLPGYMKSLLAQKGAEWTLGPNQSFLLNEQDLTLCFDHGALSAETVGAVAIPLPYAMLTNLIATSGPLAFMIDQPAPPTKDGPNIKPAKNTPPPPSAKTKTRPAKPVQSSKLGDTGNRIGAVVHTCFKENVTHTISVIEHDIDSPFTCIVEYDKVYEQKVLWRSRKTKSFCHDNAEKLVSKYENKWGYTCGRVSSLPSE